MGKPLASKLEGLKGRIPRVLDALRHAQATRGAHVTLAWGSHTVFGGLPNGRELTKFRLGSRRVNRLFSDSFARRPPARAPAALSSAALLQARAHRAPRNPGRIRGLPAPGVRPESHLPRGCLDSLRGWPAARRACAAYPP